LQNGVVLNFHVFSLFVNINSSLRDGAHNLSPRRFRCVNISFALRVYSYSCTLIFIMNLYITIKVLFCNLFGCMVLSFWYQRVTRHIHRIVNCLCVLCSV